MKSLLTVLAALYMPFFVLSNPSEVIDWANFDNDRYNSMLINEIQKFRSSHIECDSVVYHAAEMHGLYLCESKADFKSFEKYREGHQESGFSLSKNLSDRIRFFNMSEIHFDPNKGGGEVCAMFYGHNFNTYPELVNEVLSTYKKSKEHWGIVTKNGNVAGGSVHLSEDGYVYSVIVFYDKKEINGDIHKSIVSKILDGTMDSLYADYKSKRVIEYDSVLGEYEDYSNVSREAQKYIELFSAWENSYPNKSIKDKYIALDMEYNNRIDKYEDIKKAF